MRKHAKWLLMLLVVAVMSLTACLQDLSKLPSSDSSTQEPPVTESELVITPYSLTLAPEESSTLTLTYTVNGEAVEDFEAEWSTSDANVATVENGVVTAVSLGNAIITATVGETQASASVVVAEPVTLTLSETTLDLFEGENATLTVSASDGNEYDYVWTSSDSAIASVENGVVTANKEGTATIKVSNGTAEATCEVTVYEVIITMDLSQATASLKVNEDVQLSVIMSDGSTPEIEWSSSAEEVATVVDGKVVGVSAGTATITAKAGEHSATCVVTVENVYELIFLEIDNSETILVGDEIELGIVAKMNGIEQDLSEVVISGEGFTAEGKKITLTKSGKLAITVSYHGEEMTRNIECYQGISTTEEFLAIANNLSGYYMLTADLDFGGAKIASFSSYNGHKVDENIAFTGIFDGQGHSISNFEATYNQTWNAADRDRGIFGYAKNSVIKNVAFLNVKTADRASVVASFTEGASLFENIYVEATFGGSWGVNVNATNPGGYVVQKLNAGATMKNCVLVLTIPAGSFDEVEKVCGNQGKSTMFGAMVGVNSGTMENCFAIYKPEEGQETTLVYKVVGESTNSGLYTSAPELWKALDVTVLGDIWNVSENAIPHIGNLGSAVELAESEAVVNAGGSYQVQVVGGTKVYYSTESEGATVDAKGFVQIGADVAKDTVITVKAFNVYDSTKFATVTLTVGDKVEAKALVEEIAFSDIVAGGEDGKVDLGVVVKVNGVATEEFTVRSTNEGVVKVVDGKAVAVANGSASIEVVYGGAVIHTIAVSVKNVYTPIYTVEDFENIYNNQAGYYRLMNDLDFGGAEFNAFSGWTSAFDASSKYKPSFTGIFDGNGYTIKNIIPKHDGARHSSKYSSDASIFGIIGAGGVIRNLSVIARIEYRGGVIASLVNSNGLIENCYTEVTVAPSLEDYASNKQFGGIVFRSQANGVLKNNISVITLEKDENGNTANTAWMGGIAYVNYGKSYNNYAIIVSGEGLKAISVTNATTVNSNNIAFTSLASFYANSDETVFDSTLWKFERGEYPHIANLSAEVEASVSEIEISAGLSANAQFTSDRAMIISSNTAGVVYANGVISVAAEVAPGTVATITAYCAYDKTKVATITVTVKAATIEVSAEVEEIVNDKFVLGTEKTYDLGISVTSNGAAVEGYQVASSNVAVVTVENGVAKLVGDGSANITVTHEGTTLLTIPVSVVAYNPIYTTAEFLAMGTNVETMSKNYILMNDLDFGGAQIKSFCAWQTHSTHQVRWYGIFDGNGHTVSNFTSMWNDWAGTAWAATGNRDRGIFGYMWEGSVVRNVSFLNVKTGDRCGVVANFATNGALIENVYVEATVTKDGVNTNANNPAGVLVQKVTAGGIVRNCVVKLTVEEGVKADVDSKNATAWSYRAAAVGQIAGTVDNVQVIYNPFEGQALPFNVTGSATNSAIYATVADFYANANLELYDSSIWNFNAEEGYYPYVGTISAIAVDQAELEVPAGMNAALAVNAAAGYSVSSNVEGVAFANGKVTVAEDVPAGTEATLTFTCLYTGNTATVKVTVSAMTIETITAVTEITNDKFVLGTEETYELNVIVRVNGVETENYEVASSNAAVVTVENGVAKLVGNGSANIVVSYNGSTLVEIPVSVVAYTGIYNREQFEAIFSNQSGKYMLMNDLDFQGATHYAFGSWKYGHDDASLAFKGVFDGNGHAIKNVVIGVDNRHAAVQTDASIFGTVFGTVRNLAVINATVTNRGGVIASGIGNGGKIENCYVECTVKSVTAAAAANDFGPIAFRAQAGSQAIDCIAVVNILEGVPTTYIGGIVGMNLSKVINNCQAIVVSGQALPTHSTEHGTVKPGPVINSAVYTSLAAFYAGANLELFTSDLWSFEEGLYPNFGTLTNNITFDQAEVEVPAGMSMPVAVSADLSYSVSSNVEGVAFANGKVAVADSVPAETEATLTFTCLYTGATATLKVKVINLVVEGSSAITSISNDKFVLGTDKTYELGVQVTLNGVATENYELTSSNAAVATVENGVAKLVGGGSANIVVSYNGATVLEIPVSVVAYTGVYTVADFEAIYSNQAGKYMLMNDIDFGGAEFNAFSGWGSAFESPSKSAFTGIFDGNGYALKNIIPKHDGARHPSDTSSDASIFGVIGSGGVVRNLKVNAIIKYRGGVVASLINGGGKIENCYVECTVATSLADLTDSKQFGGIIFRTQNNGVLQNNICVMTLEKGENNATVNTSLVNGTLQVCYGKAYNNFSIITTGETIKALTGTNSTTVNTNNASFVSYDAFFAAEGGADYSAYNTSIWAIDAENGTIGLIAGCSVK